MFPGFDQWIRHQEHYNHYNWDTGGTHFTSQMGSHDFSKIECIRIGYRSSVIKYLTLVVPSRSLRMLQYLEGSHSFFRALAGTCLRHRFVCTQFLIHHLTWVEKKNRLNLSILSILLFSAKLKLKSHGHRLNGFMCQEVFVSELET